MSFLIGGSHRQAAIAMSLGAGMATGIGATLVLCTSSLDRRLLACTLAFSAGVMIYVSFVEVGTLPGALAQLSTPKLRTASMTSHSLARACAPSDSPVHAALAPSYAQVVAVSNEYFGKAHPPPTAYALATASLFVGVALMAAVDRLVHIVFDAVGGAHGGTHSGSHGDARGGGGGGRGGAEGGRGLASSDEESRLCDADALPPLGVGDSYDEDEGGASIRAVAMMEERRRLLMMAAVVSAAIVLHNIPEGMATYVASFHSVSAGAPLALAIAIHNIPEGLAVAMPIVYATGQRGRAIALGTLSGMSEPFGAILASLVANENSSSSAFGAMFGLTGGMMVYVCIAELLPSAFAERGVSRDAVCAAFFLGCLVMAASLVIEKLAMG